MSEYGKDPGSRLGNAAVDSVRGANAAKNIAKNIAAKNYAAAVKEAAFNFDAILKVLAVCIAIVILILVIVFYSLPKMFLSSLSDGKTSFDATIAEVQDSYKDIKDDAEEKFNELMQAAYAIANEAAAEYGEDLESSYNQGGHGDVGGYVVHVSPVLSENSPVQSSYDVLKDIYTMIALYDEDKTNYSNENPTGYVDQQIKDRLAAGEGFTVEEIGQWSDEQFAQIVSPVNIKEFKKFMRNDAPDMLKLFLPTGHGKAQAGLKPLTRTNTFNTYCEVTDIVPVTFTTPGWYDDGQNWHEGTSVTYIHYYIDYVWSIEFDGIEYMLRLYNWTILNPTTGAYEMTERAKELYPIVVDKAYNFEMVDVNGSLEFGAAGEQAFSGSFATAYADEYDQRISEGMRIDRSSREPLSVSYTITSEFNEDRYIWQLAQGSYSKRHTAIDMAVPVGNNVHAPCDGEVIFSGNNGNGGITIVMYAGTDGSATYYFQFLHLNETWVRAGDRVKKGDVIGQSGNTGNSTGPHLHFQLDKCTGNTSSHIDPRTLVPSIPRNQRR